MGGGVEVLVGVSIPHEHVWYVGTTCPLAVNQSNMIVINSECIRTNQTRARTEICTNKDKCNNHQAT